MVRAILPNPNGLKADYLWHKVLARESLADILENYAQMVQKSQVWPRYHQLEVVRKLLADLRVAGVGKRYLIQHSAGSGKSNSIAWLAHQLIGLERQGEPVFDSIIVVTDRVILDRQIGGYHQAVYPGTRSGRDTPSVRVICAGLLRTARRS